ncbi:apoptosis inhibitory 5 [Obelidium mucronatum]|nr:apoptosis inhibitory 5 [Obelidium mucronatum]
MAAEANLPSLEELTAADITLTNVHNTDELDPNLAAYAVCLNAARGEVRVKIKAADSIPRFFALFPSLMDEAVDRQLDLCEDDELKVRHAAIKALPLFVKQRPGFAFKISDVLCQLLQTELSDELDIVETALISCYSHNPVFTAKTIFDQLVSGAIPHIRAKLLKFLLTTLNGINDIPT